MLDKAFRRLVSWSNTLQQDIWVSDLNIGQLEQQSSPAITVLTHSYSRDMAEVLREDSQAGNREEASRIIIDICIRPNKPTQ